MRSEADKIAERLLKTEEELDRLRKQGQLIGESLRRQKLMKDPALAPSHPFPQPETPRSSTAAKEHLAAPQLLLSASPLAASNTITSASNINSSINNVNNSMMNNSSANKENPPFVNAPPAPAILKLPDPDLTSAPVASPALASAPIASSAPAPVVSPAPAPAASPAPPTAPAVLSPGPAAASFSITVPLPVPVASPAAPASAPTEGGEGGLGAVSQEEAAKLGLPQGTLWFDPTNDAQRKLIEDQIARVSSEKAPFIPPQSPIQMHNAYPLSPPASVRECSSKEIACLVIILCRI